MGEGGKLRRERGTLQRTEFRADRGTDTKSDAIQGRNPGPCALSKRASTRRPGRLRRVSCAERSCSALSDEATTTSREQQSWHRGCRRSRCGVAAAPSQGMAPMQPASPPLWLEAQLTVLQEHKEPRFTVQLLRSGGVQAQVAPSVDRFSLRVPYCLGALLCASFSPRLVHFCELLRQKRARCVCSPRGLLRDSHEFAHLSLFSSRMAVRCRKPCTRDRPPRVALTDLINTLLGTARTVSPPRCSRTRLRGPLLLFCGTLLQGRSF